MKNHPNLKWVVVMRHAKDGQGDIPTPESEIYIQRKLAPAMLEKFKGSNGISAVFTSLELRGVITGNHLSRGLGRVTTLSLKHLSGDSYNDGAFIADVILKNLDQRVQLAVVVGHFEAVPGIVSALAKPFGVEVPCFEPKYLEGLVVNAETGECHKMAEFLGLS